MTTKQKFEAFRKSLVGRDTYCVKASNGKTQRVSAGFTLEQLNDLRTGLCKLLDSEHITFSVDIGRATIRVLERQTENWFDPVELGELSYQAAKATLAQYKTPENVFVWSREWVLKTFTDWYDALVTSAHKDRSTARARGLGVGALLEGETLFRNAITTKIDSDSFPYIQISPIRPTDAMRFDGFKISFRSTPSVLGKPFEQTFIRATETELAFLITWLKGHL